MKKPELLAPAGSMESLYAAVSCGADAVYLGGSKFSARAYASNFDNEKIAEAVKYCHIYGVKVHVAINILVKDSEMEEALEYAGFLNDLGVDALIVQDAGLAKLISGKFPDFELHASTQMTVHNTEGAIFIKSLGFKRIVLARELSLAEIGEMTKNLALEGLETEMFIHGALCISYSGQCLMSSLIGGRSGNRGRCAQPCRLPYSLIQDPGGREEKGYLLSPKDICTLDVLEDICMTGISSLKIEGRMKKPEYVAGVVSAYRKMLDSIYDGKNDFNIKKEKEKLLQLFNREGFSKAYLFGNTGKDMMAYSRPKNSGIRLGTADETMSISLLADIAAGDGVSVGDKGFRISKIVRNGVEAACAYRGEKVRIFPGKYKRGDIIYKTSDSRFLSELAESYARPYSKKIDVFLEVWFKPLNKARVDFIYKGERHTVFGDEVSMAVSKPVTKEKFIENISKTQNTPFNFHVKMNEFEEGFLPISSINEIRRKIIEEIENVESAPARENYAPKPAVKPSKKQKTSDIGRTLVVVNSMEQLKAALKSKAGEIAINIFGRNTDLSINKAMEMAGCALYLKIPNIIKEEYESVCSLIDENLGKIKGLVTGNLGIIKRYSGRTCVIGDYKLNIFNSDSLEFYLGSLDLACLSVELNKEELKKILKIKGSQALVYGKIELMASEYCAIGSIFGGKSEISSCSKPCVSGRFILRDRKGAGFAIITDQYCRSHIYNSVPLNLIQNIGELSKMGVEHFRLDFIDEGYEETLKILECYKKGSFEGSFEKYTRGHYKRGVE